MATRFPFACSSSIFAAFSLGQHLREHGVDAELARDGVGHRLGVAGEHHDLDARVVQPLHRLARLRADRVGDGERGEAHASPSTR